MSNFGVMLEKFGNDWRVLETAMCRHLNSEIALISEIGIRQLTGGKKLRALISLLSGRLCGLPQEQSEKMASAVEFIHAALYCMMMSLMKRTPDDDKIRPIASTATPPPF